MSATCAVGIKYSKETAGELPSLACHPLTLSPSEPLSQDVWRRDMCELN